MKDFIDYNALWDDILRELPDGGVIGISGFGGLGKTELAKKLGRDKPGIQLVYVDDYLDWPRVCEEIAADEPDDGIDFESILTAHIQPLKSGTKPVNYLIVEGIRLFRDDRAKYFDYKVWVDLSLGEAEALGRSREAAKENQELWTIWSANARSFADFYKPKLHADAVYDWRSSVE